MERAKYRQLRTGAVCSVVAIAVGLSALNSGCGKSESCPYITEDQQESLMSPASQYPIVVVIDSRFSSGQIAAINRMLDEWNRIGSAMGRSGIFQTGTVSGPSSEAIESSPDDCQADPVSVDSERGRTLFIYSENNAEAWGSKFQRGVLAVTNRCTSGSDVVGMRIFVNSPAIDERQFSSVILHELGHAVGLGHSCALDNGGDHFVSCAKLPSSHAYRDAVMYPTLQVVPGGTNARRNPLLESAMQVKENLRENDSNRTRCLLGG